MSKGTPACGRPSTSPWRNRFLCVAAFLGGKGHAPHSEGDVKVSQPHPLAQQGGVGNGLSHQPHGTGKCYHFASSPQEKTVWAPLICAGRRPNVCKRGEYSLMMIIAENGLIFKVSNP